MTPRPPAATDASTDPGPMGAMVPDAGGGATSAPATAHATGAEPAGATAEPTAELTSTALVRTGVTVPLPPGPHGRRGRRLPVRRMGLGGLFDDLAAAGSGTAVVLGRPLDIAPDGGTRWTIGRLADLVRDWSGRIAGTGVRPGDRVAVVKPDHWDYVLLACAAARAGAVPVLLSAALPAPVLATLLARARPALLLADPGVLAEARTAGVDLTRHAARTAATTPAGAPAPHPSAAAPHIRDQDAPLLVVHTSGTTGVPKLAVHSTRTLVRRLAAFEAHAWPVVSVRGRDVVASAVPFAHGRAVTWTMSALWRRPRAVVLPAAADPRAALDLLAAHRPTVLEAPPATYERWARHAGHLGRPFADVRMFISTFDAMHPPAVRTLLAASARRAPLWMQGWGLSETGPLTFRFLTRRALAPRAAGHPTTRDLGRPVPGRTALRVIDPVTLRRLPPGRPGLILARTRACCTGYLGEDARFAGRVSDGWFTTGDLGVLGRGGALRLLDREADMIPGGSCVEIEDVLHDRLADLVHEVVVLGVTGALPHPVLVTAHGELPPARWAQAVAGLPPLAPPLFLAADQVPRTGTGKVRRHVLRERLLPGTTPYGTGRWT